MRDSSQGGQEGAFAGVGSHPFLQLPSLHTCVQSLSGGYDVHSAKAAFGHICNESTASCGKRTLSVGHSALASTAATNEAVNSTDHATAADPRTKEYYIHKPVARAAVVRGCSASAFPPGVSGLCLQLAGDKRHFLFRRVLTTP